MSESKAPLLCYRLDAVTIKQRASGLLQVRPDALPAQVGEGGFEPPTT